MDPRVVAEVAAHPCPLVFATISGAHLYGFPSPDSDYDIRGTHVLTLKDVVGLQPGEETIARSHVRDGLEIDLVTHDVRKFFDLMLKRNGYVLEQVLSPLVVRTTPEHEELRELAHRCMTRHHSHHYLGFAATEWKLFGKESPPRVKPLLYVYRVLLTGIHLMRSGEVLSNLETLCGIFGMPHLRELIRAKVEAKEKATLSSADTLFHEREYARLVSVLEDASRASTLPDAPTAREGLNDLLIRLRLRDRPAGA